MSNGCLPRHVVEHPHGRASPGLGSRHVGGGHGRGPPRLCPRMSRIRGRPLGSEWAPRSLGRPWLQRGACACDASCIRGPYPFETMIGRLAGAP